MTLKIEDAIEEIERALAGNKPKYANDIYLNNAIRYLQEIKAPSLTDDQQVVLGWLKEEHDRSPNTLRGFNRIHMGTLTPIGDETTADKVEVPDFVAEWYEANKDNLEMGVSNQVEHGLEVMLEPRSEFDEWFFIESSNPIETIIKMKLYGYTVKPKRWVVKRADKFFEKFYGYGLRGTWAIYQNQAYLFDDKSKAEAVATLVDGSVEEV